MRRDTLAHNMGVRVLKATASVTVSRVLEKEMSITESSCTKVHYLNAFYVNELRLLINTRAVTDNADSLAEIDEDDTEELSKEFAAYMTFTTSKVVEDRINVSMSMHIMHTSSMEVDKYMDYTGLEVDSGNQDTLVRGIPRFFRFKESTVPSRSDEESRYLLFPSLCVIATLEKYHNEISYTFVPAKPVAKMYITTVSGATIFEPQEEWARKKDANALPHPPPLPQAPTSMDKWLEEGKSKRAKRKAEASAAPSPTKA